MCHKCTQNWLPTGHKRSHLLEDWPSRYKTKRALRRSKWSQMRVNNLAGGGWQDRWTSNKAGFSRWARY